MMVRKCSSRMKFLFVKLLIFFSFMDSQSDCFKLVGAGAHLVAVAGEDLILPCSIQPNTSAVDMRVEWFRLDVVDSLVHLYKDQSDRNEGQILNYRGRTELFREELQKGNTSLRLSAVRVSDEGAYKCLVEANSWYDDITVNVTVKVLGTEPVITMEGYDNSGGLSLVCESRGWNPEPEVLWLNREGVSLTAEDTETHRDTEGFTVRSRITVYNSDRIHCRLLQKHHLREAEIIISDKVFHTWRAAVFSISILTVATTVGVVVSTICVYQTKVIQRRMKMREIANQELQKDLEKEKAYAEIQRERVEDEFKKKKKYAVDVTLDPETASPKLLLSEDGKQVTHKDLKQNLPDDPGRFDYSPCVLGKEGFSSGRFYYEVQVSGKTKWDLGVARESINRKGTIALSPENGFWAVVLRKEHEYSACVGSSIRFSLKEKPQKLGVFVDYEEGLVSFYDVEAMSHIYSFTGQSFTEKLYPYFSPSLNDGGKNSAPLIISPVTRDD
ncbi:butyrophilin subfamily 1 member A1-like [Astyanax mexicanus]|uniref:butyrophilin subfamily 1 member A1-like n=1 Tax=Astyanax mexicanus TaxID=7994 RepID=UPI0020CAAD5B|nr:butyrophilin subfamily 1 member A1-like [Astyanax mexicanus]